MVIQNQIALAEKLRALHISGKILVLPNVWDVASARLLEAAGASAVATSSGAIAFSLGYADGEEIACGEMVEVVKRIARSVRIPVTADFEAGYGSSPDSVAANVEAVIQAGAVGINLEDAKKGDVPTLEEEALQVEKIRAIRARAESLGMPLVINARTDVYLSAIGDPSTRFDHTVRRANAYREAGADCLFVPGVIDAETIGKLTRAIHGPVNILAGPGCPPISELQKLGVARVSVGSKAFCAVMGVFDQVARELLEKGTFTRLESKVNYTMMMNLMRAKN